MNGPMPRPKSRCEEPAHRERADAEARAREVGDQQHADAGEAQMRAVPNSRSRPMKPRGRSCAAIAPLGPQHRMSLPARRSAARCRGRRRLRTANHITAGATFVLRWRRARSANRAAEQPTATTPTNRWSGDVPQRREQEAVARHVVAGKPAVVPQREALAGERDNLRASAAALATRSREPLERCVDAG